MISAKPMARMTSPIATAGRYVSATIQTRMVGSMERYFTRARAWPSFSSGTGDSVSCRSPGARSPFGRFWSRSWRLVFDTLEGNIFVGDFRAAAGVTTAAATTVRIVSGRGVAFHVVAAGACCCAATAACCSTFGAATQHAEIGRNNLCGCPLLALFVLPFPRLKAAFEIKQRALFQILLSDFGQFAPHDDLVPLGTLLALAVFVFVRLIGGHGKICDGLAAARVARLGIAAQSADENDFIDGHRKLLPPRSGHCEERSLVALLLGMTILLGSSLY